MSERRINKVHGILIQDVRVDDVIKRVTALENSGGGGGGGGGTSDVSLLTVETTQKLPNPGQDNVVYFIRSTGETYKWDSMNRKYFCAGADYHSISCIDGNTTN